MSKRASPKGVTSRMLVSFHNARFISGDLLNKPIKLHTGYTQAGGACRSSKASHRHKVLVIGAAVDRELGVSLKPGSYGDSTYPMEWNSRWALRMTRDTATLERRMVWALSSYGLWSGPTHISIQMEFLSECPNLRFGVFRAPSKGVPVTPHYLSLGHIAIWHKCHGWQWLHTGLPKGVEKVCSAHALSLYTGYTDGVAVALSLYAAKLPLFLLVFKPISLSSPEMLYTTHHHFLLLSAWVTWYKSICQTNTGSQIRWFNKYTVSTLFY